MIDAAAVAIAQATDATAADPSALLSCALDAIGFETLGFETLGFETLGFETQSASSDPSRRALVLVDLGAFESHSPVLPSRALVEQVIDRLGDMGWQHIALASSPDDSSTWAENRAVPVLADLFGYTYETARGTPYDILDLSEDLVDGGFDHTTPFAGGMLSRAWRDAGLRLVVAKASTDQHDTLTLAAHTLRRAWPAAEPERMFPQAADAARALSLLLDRAPLGLCIVDLCGVAHGSGGRNAPRRAPSAAVVVGRDLVTVDAAAASKMGADPGCSPLWSALRALRGGGVPRPIRGNLVPLPGIELPDPLLVNATRARDRSPTFRRLLSPWLQRVDTASFPLQHPIDARLQARIAPRLGALDTDETMRAAIVALNHVCVAIDFALDAWRINYDKDQVGRRLAGISPETLACTEADYQAMVSEMQALEAWLDTSLPPTDDNAALRWRKLDGAVVFCCTREIAVPLEEFRAKVDISRVIQSMSDYLGGSIVVLQRDEQGRPIRQAERNLYLPQPNYLAWWGSKPIDVAKIESIEHAADHQRMFWKTILSENGSAIRDDGIVTFAAAGEGITRVTIFGCQHFPLPPMLEALRPGLRPDLESHLIDHAYGTFFSRTFAAFEALLEGRDIAIGRAPPDPALPLATTTRPIEALAATATRLAEAIVPLVKELLFDVSRSRLAPGDPAASAGTLDTDGFLHFQAPPAAPPHVNAMSPATTVWGRWFDGALEALLRDLAVSRQQHDPWARGERA
ncbi:hypothetical protein [Pendulispora albinea]|uniref:DUF362 domain-containing protein n=1 Tax=Pendulispora albinea TaxID=2741071 RepID=A0ABZ2LNM1_9BACT